MDPKTTRPATTMVVRVRNRNQGCKSGPEASSPSFASPSSTSPSPDGEFSVVARCTTEITRLDARDDDDGDARDARRTALPRPDRDPRVEEPPDEATVPTPTRAGIYVRGPATRTRANDEVPAATPATAATRAAMTIGRYATPYTAARGVYFSAGLNFSKLTFSLALGGSMAHIVLYKIILQVRPYCP